MKRRLAAILAADVVGYSRLMGANEVGTLSDLREIRTGLIEGAVAEDGGRIFKLMGDGILAEFGSVVGALRAALAIQESVRQRNLDVPEDRQIRFRMGINLGDVVVEDDDIFGDGVNIAARIEALAKPGGVAVSGAVRDQVGNRLDIDFEYAGEPKLKNIETAVTVFHVRPQIAEPLVVGGQDLPSRPSIAVLPFNNMSGDPEQEYFADGITEDLITDLSKLSSLFVVSRNSVFVYKGKAVNSKEVARELGVRHVLEGSVRKAGQRVRITSQLTDAITGGHLWAERFDRDLSDIFALQDEITKTIIGQLQVRLLEVETKNRPPTDNVEAYNCCLKGRQLFHTRTKQNLELARKQFLQALRHDPKYARAYVGLADSEARLNDWFGGQYPAEDVLAMARRALELAPEMADAHAAHALALQMSGEDEAAEESYRAALAIDPLCYEAHHNFARYYRAKGDRALSAYHFTRALEIDPDDYRSPLLLMGDLVELGRIEEADGYFSLALKRAEDAASRNPDNPDPLELGACVLAARGDHARARDWLDRAQATDPDRQMTDGYNVACAYALMGEDDLALDLLEEIFVKLGHAQREWMRTDSDFKGLQDNQRFVRLFETRRDSCPTQETAS